MRKIIYTLFVLCYLAGNLVAQQCTNPGSGPTQCTASTLSQPGLSPRTDSLPPFTNGVASTTVIQFKNFNTVLFSGFTLTVQSLRIDSIENLPSGLCWATDRANNTYGNQENGCIKVNGTPCAQPGQYKLRIWVFVNVGITSQLVNAESAGLRYFLRVGNNGDVVPACDTLQTVPLYTTGYSPTAICGTPCPTLTFTQNSTGNSSCANPNGSLSVTAAGGQTPYTYSITGSSNSTGTFNGLAGGNYTVTATDANQCTGTVSVSVGSSTPTITATQTSTPSTSCSNPNGTMTITASGGQSPYGYAYASGSNATGIFSNVPGATYTVTITDANQCTGTVSVTVGNPVVTVTATTTPVTTCSADNGTVTGVATGGTPPYSYTLNLSNNSTGVFAGQPAGSNTVVATDATGCTGLVLATVADNTPTITVTASSTNASTSTSANGTATATAAGGTSYTYAWSNQAIGGNINGLLPGSYTVTATDASGCTGTASVTVGFNSGINSLAGEISDLHIFPNPATDNFTLTATLANAKNVSVEIYTLTGQKVQSVNIGNVSKINEKLNVKNLAKGTYVVSIKAGSQSANYNIEVQ